MKIIDRYLFTSFFLTFIFCTIFLYVIFVIGDIFGFLDEILRANIGAKSLFDFYLYMMPTIITQVVPVSCLLASVFLLGNLNRHNEIIALKASGVSLISILKPMIITALVAGAFLFLLNDRVVPNTMRMANKIRYDQLEAGKSGPSKIIRNIALYGQGNKIIFVKEFDIKKNLLSDIIIHEDNPEEGTISKMSIKVMEWHNNKWLGKDVVTYRVNRSGEFSGSPDIIPESEIKLKETPLDFINNQWQPQYMSYTQLKKYLNVFLGGSTMAKKRFTVDLQYKLSFPFSCVVMLLIAAPYAIVTRRGAALLGMAKGILIALTYVPLVAVGLALGKGGILHPVLSAWFANIVLGGIGIIRLLRN